MTSIPRRKSHGATVKSREAIRPAKPKPGRWGYLIMWEFQVRAGMEKRFTKAYKSNGDWARFFAQDKSYIGTELIHNLKDERACVTLDFWTSQQAYDKFRKQHLAKYSAIDRKCENLTVSEREIGRFVRISSK